MTSSPLGKYSDIAATLVSVAVVLAWLSIHGALILGVAHAGDTSQVDTAATLIIGVIVGQRATTNGATAVAASANLRLDAIGAPSAAASPALIAAGVPPLPPTPPHA